MNEITFVRIIFLVLLVMFPMLSFIFFRQYRKELLLVLISLVFIAVVAEGLLAAFYPQVMEHDQMFEYDPTLGWRFIANKKSAYVAADIQHHWVKINKLGFRDKDAGISFGDKNKKIMVIGDSFVSNLAVKDGEVFTELVEQQLKNTSVMNFGVNGYGQVQEYLLLKQLLKKVKPDLVILMIYVRNDFIDNIGGYWFHPRPYALFNEHSKSLKIHSMMDGEPAKETFNVPFWKFYKKSNLYWFVNERVKILLRKFLHPDEYQAPELYLCNAEPTKKTELMDSTMEAILVKIASLLKGEYVPFVIAVAPSMVQVNDGLWESVVEGKKLNRLLPSDKLMRWAKKNRWNLIDLLPSLRTAAHESSLYNPVNQHWSAEGNRVVAKELGEYLQEPLLYN